MGSGDSTGVGSNFIYRLRGHPGSHLPALAATDDSYVLEYDWGSPGNTNYEGLWLEYSQAETSSFVSTATTYSPTITGAEKVAVTPIAIDVTTSGWGSLVPPGEPADGTSPDGHLLR